MPTTPEIAGLNQRKVELLARSSLQRDIIRLEGIRLTQSLSGVDRGIALARQSRWLWAAVLPAAGWLMVRRWRFFFRFGRRLALGWTLLRRFRAVFQKLDRVLGLRGALAVKRTF